MVKNMTFMIKILHQTKRLLLVVKFNKTARKFISPYLGPNLVAKPNPTLKRKSKI